MMSQLSKQTLPKHYLKKSLQMLVFVEQEFRNLDLTIHTALNFADPTGRMIMLTDDYMASDEMVSLRDRLISKDNIELGSTLGQGQFGKVFKGKLLMRSGSTKQVACKTMKRKQ